MKLNDILSSIGSLFKPKGQVLGAEIATPTPTPTKLEGLKQQFTKMRDTGNAGWNKPGIRPLNEPETRFLNENQESFPNGNFPRTTPTPTQPVVLFGSTKQNRETDNFLDNVVLPITRRHQLPDPVVAGMYGAEGRTGGLGASRKNYFNVGAFDSNLDNTYEYDTPEAGIEAFAKLLTGKYELGQKGSGKFDTRYIPAYQLRNDPVAMIKKIKELGYASRPDYPEFIQQTPEWKKYYKPL